MANRIERASKRAAHLTLALAAACGCAGSTHTGSTHTGSMHAGATTKPEMNPLAASDGKAGSLVTVADMAAMQKLIDAYDRTPPFRFTYDGKPSSDFLAQWNPQTQEKSLDRNRTQRTTTWTDPAGGLTARLVSIRYHDFPAIEWTAYLKNDGTADTKKIDDLRGIDAVVGHAPKAAREEQKITWSAGASMPAAPTGGMFETYRGWVNAYQPMAKAEKRFDVAGNAPWISADPDDATAILMSPALGLENATDVATTGKSPALAFKAPAFGNYRVSGKITMTTSVGDGVEWLLHGEGGTILAHGNLDAGKSAPFETVGYLKPGDHVFFTMNSRANIEGDIARVNFDVTQMNPPGKGDITVHAEKGSDATENDYSPLPIGIAPDQSFSLTSAGGRGSDGMAIPYFNLEMPGTSACIAIGWPGQWDATFKRDGDDVYFIAGQENVHAVLHAGEEIRTPLMAIVAYDGVDTQRGQNLWRRWMIAHNMPRVDGKLIGPFVAAGSSHVTHEMTQADEVNQIGFIDAHLRRDIKLDYWWMDAGWYEKPTAGWEYVGTWKPDRRRFPDGFRPVSDFAHSRDVNTIVWFEPERVMPGTELSREHQDFLLSPPVDPNNTTVGMVYKFPTGKDDPNASYNPTDKVRNATDGPVAWQPKQFALHPGKAEFSVARYTAPADGDYKVNAMFAMCDTRATTDVHLVAHGMQLLTGELAPAGAHEHKYDGTITAKRGDTIDFVVGYGANKDYTCDSTLLSATITGPDGETSDVRSGFTDPNDHAWTYGEFPQGDPAKPTSFTPFDRPATIGDPANGMQLLDLGNPKAREWITDRIDSILKQDRISVYRQDFNMPPLSYWRAHDAADRQGVTENLYLQGYLKYWDTLRERNPKLYIDSCASGGRRNDLETMRRATPFLRSDYCFFPTGQQSHSYGAFQWLPLNGTGVEVGDSALSPAWKFDVDPYVFRSDMASVYTLALDIHNGKYDWKKFAELVKQYREVSPAYLGDYYPLTESSLDPAKWIAWQFYLPEKGEGFVQAFRREAAADASMKLKLHGLDRAATYDLIDVDHRDVKRSATGAQLLDDGLDVTIDAKPGAMLMRIVRQK